jgi:hypothetical protein
VPKSPRGPATSGAQVVHHLGHLLGDGVAEVGPAAGEVDEVSGVDLVQHDVVLLRGRHWEASGYGISAPVVNQRRDGIPVLGIGGLGSAPPA